MRQDSDSVFQESDQTESDENKTDDGAKSMDDGFVEFPWPVIFLRQICGTDKCGVNGFLLFGKRTYLDVALCFEPVNLLILTHSCTQRELKEYAWRV